MSNEASKIHFTTFCFEVTKVKVNLLNLLQTASRLFSFLFQEIGKCDIVKSKLLRYGSE